MTIKKLIVSALFLMGLSANASDPLQSILTDKVNLPGIGNIKFRPPVAQNMGSVVVLMQGVFGGTTHRHMSEIRDLLDKSGARVYTLDLPGTGESDSPKIVYDMPTVDIFVTEFLSMVVKEPAIFVGEELLGSSALEVSKTHPELFQKIVLIQPSGVLFIAGPSNQKQTQFFDSAWNDQKVGDDFYSQLVGEQSARYYMNRAYFDPAQVTDQRVQEITMTSQFKDQKWVSICFVGGKMFRSFESASAGVTVPTLVLFGEHPQAPFAGAPPETVDMFQKIAPSFTYKTFAQSANLPHREQPSDVVTAILDFAKK